MLDRARVLRIVVSWKLVLYNHYMEYLLAPASVMHYAVYRLLVKLVAETSKRSKYRKK